MFQLNEDLISLVYSKRCLWNQQDKFYHNRHIIEQSWNKIAMVLNTDVAWVKKKWKQLRDTFRSELKKIPPDWAGDAGPEGGKQTYTQWSHFNSMWFVKDQLKYRKSSGNLKQNSVEETFNNDDGEDNSNSIDVKVSNLLQKEKNCELFSSESNTFQIETATTSQNASKNLKRRHHEMESEIINMEKKRLSRLENKYINKIQSEDEDMAFFVSLLPHVKRMDPETKLLCRMEMQASVYNHAYDNARTKQKQTQSTQNRNRLSITNVTTMSQFSDNASSNDERENHSEEIYEAYIKEELVNE